MTLGQVAPIPAPFRATDSLQESVAGGAGASGDSGDAGCGQDKPD